MRWVRIRHARPWAGHPRLSPVQVTAWTTTFLYLYFALARAAFMRTHCIARGKALDEASLARAAMAFDVALAGRRRSLSLLVAACLAMGGAADMGLSGASVETHETVASRILAAAILVWFAWCPRFLVACGAWAVEGSFALGRANALVRRLPGRFRTGWIVAVAVIAAVSLGANAVLYLPLRTLVVAILPSARAVYLFSAAFYAAIVAFQLALQSAFAAWIAPLLLSAKDEAAPPLEKQGAWSGAWICRVIGALLGSLALTMTQVAVSDWWRATEARVLASAPACSVRLSQPGWQPEIMPCDGVDTFRESHPGLPVAVARGAVLTLAFTDRSGAERTVEHFFTAAIADRAMTNAAVRIVYDPAKPATVLPALPIGLSWIVWALAILFGGLGALFFWLAERIRRRGTGSAGAG
jgi:hypothetical protein